MSEQPEVLEVDVAAQAVSYAHPDGWVYLSHPDIAGSTRIPDDPDVLAAQQARGWVIVEAPDPAAVPAPVVHTGPPPPPEDEWISMTHPDTEGMQRLPNDDAAISGAREAGWVTTAEAETAAAGSTAADVADRTVAEVLDLVDGDPTKAAAALAAERDGKKRSSLISALEAITAAPGPDATTIPTTEQES